MSKVVFMFPGQGAQYIGMGKDFYDACEESKAVYELASKVTGLDIAKLCFEENEEINRAVALSGLSKQEYCYRRCMERDVVVQGNPRVYKALKNQMADILTELQRIAGGESVPDELLYTIELIAATLGGLKGEDDNGE